MRPGPLAPGRLVFRSVLALVGWERESFRNPAGAPTILGLWQGTSGLLGAIEYAGIGQRIRGSLWSLVSLQSDKGTNSA